MGIEPTRDLIGPTLVLKTRGNTSHQSPPDRIVDDPNLNQLEDQINALPANFRNSWAEHWAGIDCMRGSFVYFSPARVSAMLRPWSLIRR